MRRRPEMRGFAHRNRDLQVTQSRVTPGDFIVEKLQLKISETAV